MNDVSVTEGNAGSTTATFTVTLSAASGQAVTVDWATSAGTATAGTDYVAASGSRTIAAGATTAMFTVTVDGDTLDEANETYAVTLSNPGNATIADGSGTGTITDDDPLPTPLRERRLRHRGQRRVHDRDLHGHPVGRERPGRHGRLGHLGGHRHRRHGLRRRERQPHDRRRRHEHHHRP